MSDRGPYQRKDAEVTLRPKPDRRRVPRDTPPARPGLAVVDLELGLRIVDRDTVAQRRVLEVFDDLVWGRP